MPELVKCVFPKASEGFERTWREWKRKDGSKSFGGSTKLNSDDAIITMRKGMWGHLKTNGMAHSGGHTQKWQKRRQEWEKRGRNGKLVRFT